MISKKILMLLAILFGMSITVQAQIETEPEDEVDEEDEIVVIDQSGNEEIIEFPEAMTYDLDSLLNEYMAKTYLTSGDCNMRNENPHYPEEVYIERLSRMPTVMEMAHNNVVQQFIDRYASRLRGTIAYCLGAGNFYMPIFEEALETYQIPLELKYLPVIESALNPKAVSRVGAAGLWQFMPATGRQYNLQMNSLVDERRDPIKASYAAAHLLSDLYKVFGDWNLVIAAYNCGPGNVSKAIQRSGGSKDYWQIYPYLPRETRGYVPAFIAANYMMTYYSLHNICPMSSRLPAQTDTVMVTKKIHLEQIAKVLNVDIEMLRALNPMYRHDIIPGNTEPYALRLPLSDVNRYIENEDAICNYKANELLTNRTIVEVNDYTPTYYHKSKRSYKKGRKGRIGRHSKARRGGKKAAAKKGRATKRKSKGRKSSRRRRR
ncbi:MAG: lytic transglycosylase domain-containing protein [Prevotella sp.]|nr:lytic transglycosylase domain-containing protein [Prevotella sp.]